MRRLIVTGLIAAALAGCTKKEETTATVGNGRFLGVGVYSPDELWAKQKLAPQAADPSSATLDDDGEIIVVVDSRTGEVRQCGNMSGHCISLNPWKAGAPASPVALTQHAADLRAAMETTEAAPTPNTR